jgi:hypothetical protein
VEQLEENAKYCRTAPLEKEVIGAAEAMGEAVKEHFTYDPISSGC